MAERALEYRSKICMENRLKFCDPTEIVFVGWLVGLFFSVKNHLLGFFTKASKIPRTKSQEHQALFSSLCLHKSTDV